MSRTIIYNSVQPETLRDSYTEYDNVDFLISGNNVSLMCGSITLDGDITLTGVTGNAAVAANQFIDPKIGAHSFIDTITVSFEKTGNATNETEIPRAVRALSEGTLQRDDYNNSKLVPELRYSGVNMTTSILFDDVLGNKKSFSIKPNFSLNKPVANPFLSLDKYGSIRVSLRLNRNVNVFYGSANNGITYALSRLRMSYKTVPGDTKEPVILSHNICIKQTIDSTRANISTNVPAPCRSVYMTFTPVPFLSQNTFNNYQNYMLPGLSEVIFMFNNNTNQMITYPLRDNVEILKNYLKAIDNTSTHSGLALNNLNIVGDLEDNGGVGLDFGEILDLRNEKFSVQLTSVNTSAVMVFMFFKAYLQL